MPCFVGTPGLAFGRQGKAQTGGVWSCDHLPFRHIAITAQKARHLQSLIDLTMLEAASLVLDHRGASGCAVKFIWTRMPHAVSEERCAASCDASAIEHERGIGRLHGGRGFAAKTDNVENGVSCGAICGRCTHRLSKPQVGWYFMTADPCVCPISTKHAKITSFPWT